MKSRNSKNVACILFLTAVTTLSLFNPVLSAIKISPTSTSTQIGFSAKLIHRDSLLSPISVAGVGKYDRLHQSFLRSTHRARTTALATSALGQAIPNRDVRGEEPSPSPSAPVESEIVMSNGEYLMNVSIGSPPVTFMGIADTGSDLIWTQCKPCKSCYKQTLPIFDPSKSSTYQNVECDSEKCTMLEQTSGCLATNDCAYKYGYGDQSFTTGNLATETITVGDFALEDAAFGCGHNNAGTFDEAASGLIGLGGGQLSLVSQLGAAGAGKFSYCLVPFGDESAGASKISFGDDAVVSGQGTVSTPIVVKDPSTFYFLTLEAISVANKSILYRPLSKPSSLLAAEEGNIIIDSGTTLTYLPEDFHDDLVSAMSEALKGAERVKDPRGRMSLCYRDSGAGEGLKAPPVTMHFAGKADVVLPMMNTFVRTEEDVVCFTFVPSRDVAIFGNLAQMNFLVGYDTGTEAVSFKPVDCSKWI